MKNQQRKTPFKARAQPISGFFRRCIGNLLEEFTLVLNLNCICERHKYTSDPVVISTVFSELY